MIFKSLYYKKNKSNVYNNTIKNIIFHLDTFNEKGITI